MKRVGRGRGRRFGPGRGGQGAGLDVARRGGPLPAHLRAAPGGSRRHARSRRHRRAVGGAGPGHPAHALLDPAAQDLHDRHRAGHGHLHPRRLGRGDRDLRHVPCHPRNGHGGHGGPHGGDRAGAAHGVGGQGGWPAAARAGPPGAGGRAGTADGHGVPLRRRARLRTPRCVSGRGGVLVGHLRPRAGAGPRPGARWRGARRPPAPDTHRLLRRPRDAPPRRAGPRRRAHVRPRPCATWSR